MHLLRTTPGGFVDDTQGVVRIDQHELGALPYGHAAQRYPERSRIAGDPKLRRDGVAGGEDHIGRAVRQPEDVE